MARLLRNPGRSHVFPKSCLAGISGISAETTSLKFASNGHEFWQFDHEGKVLNYLRPRFDCDCEYGLRTEYELRDFTLLKFFGKTNDSRVDDSWHWTVEVILNVDRRLDVDSPEAPAF